MSELNQLSLVLFEAERGVILRALCAYFPTNLTDLSLAT